MRLQTLVGTARGLDPDAARQMPTATRASETPGLNQTPNTDARPRRQAEARAKPEMMRPHLLIALIVGALALCPPAFAQKATPAPPAPPVTIPTEDKPPPYDGQLMRLAEILGSVHYLRTLCGADSSDWRTSMQTLLDAETLNEPKRREKLTASFNRGFRAFAGVHTACTAATRLAEERYRREGATLAAEIAARYGN